MLTKRFRRRVERGERGVALVEFALILPLFMTLVLGMFSGGRSYNQNLSLTHAAREGARYGSTLAKLPSGLGPSEWWSSVEDRVVEAAAGDLDISRPGHFICIALVRPNGSTWTDSAGNLYHQVLGTAPGFLPNNCYDDGLNCPPLTGTQCTSRVHVMVGRPASIETIFYTHSFSLESQATARYEPS